MELDLPDLEIVLSRCVCTSVLLYTHPSRGVREGTAPLARGSMGESLERIFLGCLLANGLQVHGIG